MLCAGRRDNAMRLTALDEVSERLGLKRGQGLAEARAMFPKIDVMDEDGEADQVLLEAIADWCDRYTPLVALGGREGLLLDITGCAHLFGGEEALLRDILKRLFHMGFDVKGAISSSPGLSWAACRFGRGGVIDDETMKEVLAPLPVNALRIDDAMIVSLHKLGLKRVGDLFPMPRAPLARRFGTQLLLRLDQALGANEEAISPRRPVAALSAERRLAEPIQAEEHILQLIGQIATSLRPGLEARGIGGRVFELVLFRIDGRVFRITAGASQPLRDPERISTLFSERLNAVHDDLDAGFGFELLRLNVLQHDTFRTAQGDFIGDGESEISLADFVDRVSARLGADCLQFAELRQSHMPERARVFVPAMTAGSAQKKGDEDLAFAPRSDRPLRLFHHPEPIDAFAATVPDGPPQRFRWRRIVHRVVRAEGPERISPEWWIDPKEAEERDYFRLESDAGRRFWIFREGHYDGKTAPSWRVHGIFA
ncbi:DNA polymerase Y family protein [Rhizobium sp. YS-1r]|uniref:Y-family DNA polymerase n=1 Tax=Rhizobium sp. YS-1r TaxID=1532558 RepID=UPI00244DE683|nr:DNA polymerase Y family protein [Rhizobium sp. YS-1r]